MEALNINLKRYLPHIIVVTVLLLGSLFFLNKKFDSLANGPGAVNRTGLFTIANLDMHYPEPSHLNESVEFLELAKPTDLVGEFMVTDLSFTVTTENAPLDFQLVCEVRNKEGEKIEGRWEYIHIKDQNTVIQNSFVWDPTQYEEGAFPVFYIWNRDHHNFDITQTNVAFQRDYTDKLNPASTLSINGTDVYGRTVGAEFVPLFEVTSKDPAIARAKNIKLEIQELTATNANEDLVLAMEIHNNQGEKIHYYSERLYFDISTNSVCIPDIEAFTTDDNTFKFYMWSPSKNSGFNFKSLNLLQFN